MHPGGFEPPTARFVAEYSIQLSYGCIGKAILLRGYSPGTYDGFANQITTMLLLLRRIWCIREDYSAAPRPTGRCLRNVILPGAGDNFANNIVAVIKENMVHPGGFEPPTARFVAEYSIQLSYGCIGITAVILISNFAICHSY